jgi:hypothetical protein
MSNPRHPCPKLATRRPVTIGQHHETTYISPLARNLLLDARVMEKPARVLVKRHDLPGRLARRLRAAEAPLLGERERAAGEALRAYFARFAERQNDPSAVSAAAVEAARALLTEALRAADAEYARTVPRRRPTVNIARPWRR